MADKFVRITESTPDAVITELYPVPADLLRRFEAVKGVANLADGERDGLRKYIQKHFKQGMYGNMYLQVATGAEQVYPNADGKFVLTNRLITDIDRPVDEEGVDITKDFVGEPVIIFVSMCDSPKELLDRLMAMSHEEALKYLEDNFLGAGSVVDNNSLFMKKGSIKLTITEIPNYG